MKKTHYVVYMHVFPNNKKYVGQTTIEGSHDMCTPDILNACEKHRWGGGEKYRKHNRPMFKEIMSVGWTNIKHEIVGVYDTKKEMDSVETALIKTLDLINPNNGYNQINGHNVYKVIDENTNQGKNRYDFEDININNTRQNLTMSELKEIVINILMASGVIPAKNIDKGLYRASKNENLYYGRFRIIKAA